MDARSFVNSAIQEQERRQGTAHRTQHTGHRKQDTGHRITGEASGHDRQQWTRIHRQQDNRISGSGVLTRSPCTQPVRLAVRDELLFPGLKFLNRPGQKQRAFPTTFFLELRERAPQDVRGW
ncbi:MAG: hypothetical protein J3R72DRAFT_493446 [Linnemannia gamsii]|nr:MAG: hypothetical protein J3R72DRAFT_493446 [Linnemannia gamsii]